MKKICYIFYWTVFYLFGAFIWVYPFVTFLLVARNNDFIHFHEYQCQVNQSLLNSGCNIYLPELNRNYYILPCPNTQVNQTNCYLRHENSLPLFEKDIVETDTVHFEKYIIALLMGMQFLFFPVCCHFLCADRNKLKNSLNDYENIYKN